MTANGSWSSEGAFFATSQSRKNQKGLLLGFLLDCFAKYARNDEVDLSFYTAIPAEKHIGPCFLV
jgi:hypothetical protein